MGNKVFVINDIMLCEKREDTRCDWAGFNVS